MTNMLKYTYRFILYWFSLLTMFSCRHKPCTYVSQSGYVLNRHERRCKFNRCRDGQSTDKGRSQSDSVMEYGRDHVHPVCESNEYCDSQQYSQNLFPDGESNECENGSEDSRDSEKKDVLIRISTLLLELKLIAGSKKVGQLLSLMQSEDFDIDTFRSTFSSVNELESFHQTIQHERSISFGFKKGNVYGKTEDIQGFYYFRDPIHVLQRQFEKSRTATSFFRPVQAINKEGKRIYSHPFHTDFFKSVHDSIRRTIMSSGGHVFWNEHKNSLPQSFAGAIQMYTDKTVTSLSCNGSVAHPIHIVVLNVSIEDRQMLIDEGDTLIGFLPVQNYITPPDSVYHKQDVNPTSRYDARSFRMDLLHSSIENILRELYVVCETGFPTKHDDNEDRICFPVLVSCCCDIPEMGDLSGVRSYPSSRCCPRCLVNIRSTGCHETGKPRKVNEMVSVYERCANLRLEAKNLLAIKNNVDSSKKRKEAEVLLKEYSLHSWKSFLMDCPLLPKSGDLDMYRIFTYEGLHNLHLGISRLIKTCTMKMFESSKLLTYSRNTCDRKPFSTVRYHILSGANSILAAIERDCMEADFHIDFSGNEVTSGLNGIFTKEGLRGMLEGKDYRLLDMVFPIIGTYMDRWTGFVEEAPITRIYTAYSDILNRLTLYGTHNAWTDEEIDSFRVKIKTFQDLCVDVFKDHCENGLFTPKFHLLTHLTEDLRDYSALQYLMASPFESSHILWKKAYNISSRRKNTAMDESVKNIRSRMVLENGKENDRRSKRCKNTSCHVPAVSVSRTTTLVRDGTSTSVVELTECVEEIEKYIKNSNIATAQYVEDATNCVDVPPTVSTHIDDCAFSVYKVLGIGGLKCLISMVREEVMENGLCSTMVVPPDHHIILTFVKSGNVLGGFVPTLHHFNRCDETIPLGANRSFQKQRIFGTENFSGKRRYSYVLLEGGEEGNLLWTAQIQCLFRLRLKDKNEESELSFVRYMEYTPPIDKIDEHLGCVMLRWTTTDEIDHTLSPPETKDNQSLIDIGPWYGLVPITSIRGKVNVVRSNYAVHPFSQRTAWIYDRFYINRFYKFEQCP